MQTILLLRISLIHTNVTTETDKLCGNLLMSLTSTLVNINERNNRIILK